MSGREQGRRGKDARVYNTYDALVCTQFFEKRRREREMEEEEQIEGKRRRPKTYIHTHIASFTSLRDLPIIIFFSSRI
jgi:hypothetical protein